MTFQNNIISCIKYILSRKREIAREGYAERVEIAATVSLLSYFIWLLYTVAAILYPRIPAVLLLVAFHFIVEHFSKL